MHTIHPAEVATGPHSDPCSMHTIHPAEPAIGPHSKPLPAMHTLRPITQSLEHILDFPTKVIINFATYDLHTRL